ncbi:MAG: hypothetical protein IT374_12875 [Polyangiaceae bacterium]|nr:hypothetical protein [Polyangiaceae bacterium]
MRRRVWVLSLLVAACGGSDDAPRPPPTSSAPVSGPTIETRYDGGGSGFYGSPFPGEHRRRADGAVDVAGFPNEGGVDLAKKVLALLDGERGFGTTSGVYFHATTALDPRSLPDVAGSVAAGASVFVMAVDDGARDAGQRLPLSADFHADGGPFGAPNLLSLLPVQGLPLRPGARYVAVVTTRVRDASGAPLVPSAETAALVAGTRPAGMSSAAFDDHRAALAALTRAGVATSELVAVTVWRTGEPMSALRRVRDHALALGVPRPLAPLVKAETFEDFCVFTSTIEMPVYQSGEPPFANDGGAFVFDAAGAPVLQAKETANLVLTLPRRAMPAAGFPLVVFSRTGGGGERPLVDRGTEAVHGGPPLAPGTGPARSFAQAGFAGLSIDGPHGGLRNVTKQDEQFLMFNVANPAALRDNVRQSALELALAAHVAGELSVDASACPGLSSAGPARVDAGTLALMGHSMGATISPLTAAVEPRFRALLLSGAGGSWIANVMDKKKPLAVKGIAEVLLGLAGSGYHLHEHDPLLSLFQWAGEAADPPVYGRAILAEPIEGPRRHVLMMQGIVDHYILPSIANATSLSFGLDLAGPELDSMTPELASFTPLSALLPLSGRRAISLPASANIDPSTTAVVVQHREDGLEDGHEVVFQTPAPKRQMRCFLASLAAGAAPRVPDSGPEDAPCD